MSVSVLNVMTPKRMYFFAGLVLTILDGKNHNYKMHFSLTFNCFFKVAFASEMGNGTLRAECEKGWLDGNSVECGCLKLGAEPMSLADANAYCLGEKAYLIEILTSPQMDFLLMQLELFEPIVGVRGYWGGGSDFNRDGSWYWSSSLVPVEDFVWAVGQPDGGVDQNYMAFFTANDYYACDIDTHDQYYPICQRKVI